MNDRDFDEIMQNSLPDTPPDDVVYSVTPWRKATNRIIAGLALTTVTLNFVYLQYLLPVIGTILMLLGFRALRKENRFFNYGLLTCILSSLFLLFKFTLDATVFQNEFNGHIISSIFTGASMVIALLRLICLGCGFNDVRKSAGLYDIRITDTLIMLIAWYGIITLFVLISYTGQILTFMMIIAYIFILRSLYKLSKSIDEAGYALHVAPVRISDRAFAVMTVLILIISILCGYLFLGRHPMEWSRVSTDEHASVQKIKDKLTSLGFPEDIANDLAPKDIEGLANATDVIVQTEDHPANDGRTVAERKPGNTTQYSTVYDKKELRITSIAVKFKGDERHDTYRIFHHFLWTDDPNFYGTEAIELKMSDGWIHESNSVMGGRVLYTKEGVDYTASYYDFNENLLYFNEGMYVSFSLPREGTDRRGYVCYDAFLNNLDRKYADFHVYYTHQDSPLQYPVVTAKDYAPVGMIRYRGPFVTVYDALQFETEVSEPLN